MTNYNERLDDLYSNENLSQTVKDIFRSVDREYERGDDDYEENMRSAFYVMLKRMRDRYKHFYAKQALTSLIKELVKKYKQLLLLLVAGLAVKILLEL